ncbi:toxin [Candidatus Magnetoovum chiemensis]|nr:toxin [Candidatus Magnetoovum chiemensis]
MKKNAGTIGFFLDNLKDLYVDQFTQERYGARYRFTLAHEIGHYVLHKSFIEAVSPHRINEWKTQYHNIESSQYRWIEWQANAFAGLALVPRQMLIKQVLEMKPDLNSKINEINRNPLKPTKDDLLDFLIEYIAKKLENIFNVSRDVIRIRLEKELQAGLYTDCNTKEESDMFFNNILND